MSDGYDHSNFGGFLWEYFRWFMMLFFVLAVICISAFFLAKPAVPMQGAPPAGPVATHTAPRE